MAHLLSRRLGLAERLVALLLVGLTIDNVALASSAIGLGKPWYEWANVARYAAHSVCIPPLLIAALEICRRARCRWAEPGWAWIVIFSLALAGIIYGLTMEVVGIEFVRVELYDFTRLVSDDNLPPFATIATNFVIICMGIALWRQRGWAWLGLGAALVFSVNAITATQAWGLLAGNTAELVFVLAWLVTLRRFPPDN